MMTLKPAGGAAPTPLANRSFHALSASGSVGSKIGVYSIWNKLSKSSSIYQVSTT